MNRCPRCHAPIAAEQVACRVHWYALPHELRTRIWRLYRREQGSDAHRTAVFAAVELLVAAREADLQRLSTPPVDEEPRAAARARR